MADVPVITPYDQGFIAAVDGGQAPPFPRSDASWSERLRNRGWLDGKAFLRASERKVRGIA